MVWRRTETGVLLTVTVADCVPVFLADPDSRAIALLHAGWRGAVAGIMDRGIRALEALRGVSPSGLRVHLGPAICGACYEVGPDVLQQFGRPADRSGKTRPAGVADGGRGAARSSRGIDLDVQLVHGLQRRSSALPQRITGGAGRMAAFLGWGIRCE